MTQNADIAVRCDNVWKVFGSNAHRALRAAREEGLSKAEIHEKFNCVVAVSDVSFSVAAGEVFCVMGLSGSGKSTLLRHINRLVEPTSGQVLVGGIDVNAASDSELRTLRATKIGMVFQNVALLPHRSVLQNVAYGLEVRNVDRRTRRARALEKLELVGLIDWADKYPDELSGGMQQRVGLARALAADPDILLMDEPFSALDPLIRRQLQEEFISLSQRMAKTTIFITHDLNEATMVGNRIAIMRDGHFVQVGTTEEIVRSPTDDYVAAFVRDISPLTAVQAHTIMLPVAELSAGPGLPDLRECPRVPHDTRLERLIEIAIGTERPIVVVDHLHRDIGIVTRELLLSELRRPGVAMRNGMPRSAPRVRMVVVR